MEYEHRKSQTTLQSDRKAIFEGNSESTKRLKSVIVDNRNTMSNSSNSKEGATKKKKKNKQASTKTNTERGSTHMATKEKKKYKQAPPQYFQRTRCFIR